MKNVYSYPAIWDFSGKHIAITFPDLEEALSQADTIEQALQRSNDVLKLTLESRIEDKEEIPTPTPLNEIKLTQDQKTIIATCVVNEKIKYDKKTLTIPHDLNEAAEKAGLNFSQILTKALRDELAEKL